MENNILLHSVQIYWNSIAYALENVVTQMQNILSENRELNDAVINTILTARNCSYLYGLSILDKNYVCNYTNNEILFYHQLAPLIANQDFLTQLQIIVRNEIGTGTRFFEQFLYAIRVNN